MDNSGHSSALDRPDQAVRQGNDVLTYGERAIEGGEDVLLGYGPVTTENATDPGTQKVTAPGQPEIEVECGTPIDISPPVRGAHRQKSRSRLGKFAEQLIVQDFCKQTNCDPFREPTSHATDYFDDGGGATVLIAFLKFHNSHLDNDLIEEMATSSFLKDMVNFPDMMTHKSTRKDYYEVKPNSKSGIKNGKRKLRNLSDFYAGFMLPYEPGTTYTPSREIPITKKNVEGVPIEVFLSVERSQPALLLYEFCIRGNLREANRRLGKRARKLALLGLLLGSIIPIEDPIEKPVEDPIEQPVEQPGRFPIPAFKKHEYSDTPLIVPKPYNGPIDGDFPFWYVRGLPKSPVIGEIYPVVIAYRSPKGHGEIYHTVIEFRVDSSAKHKTKLVSINTTPLNAAPNGHDPLLIRVRNQMSHEWHPKGS